MSNRWPGWVYRSGREPDPRFTFANERTFLAWVRTALALLAGGAAVESLDLPMSDVVQQLLAGVLIVLALMCAIAAWLRWALAERAIRLARPLPSMSAAGPVLVVGVVLMAIVIVVEGALR